MKRGNLNQFVLLFVAFAVTCLCAFGQKNPNILIIYADDLGYGDVRCYQPGRSKIPTPHIDKLAAQGMRFTDGHSSSGVCSPSRYSLLTGRYHWRTRLQRGIVGQWEKPLIAPERMTIASLARQQGYRTACIGKWHLGWDWPVTNEQLDFLKPSRGPVSAKQIAAWKDIFSQAIQGGPTTRGFDYYFGTDMPNWPPFCFIENDRTIGIPSEFLPAHLVGNNQASKPGPALKGWKLEDILPTLVIRSSEFIRESVKNNKPFLLFMSLTTPHTPLAVNPEWQGKSGLNPYADLVMESDAAVGSVLDALEQSGASKNTLVLFTSDNGCAPYVGEPEFKKNGHFPSGLLRGHKSHAWEGGHRVPFIARWPSVVEAGSTCEQLVCQADFLRTFAEIFSVELPQNAGEDSFSLLPLLKGADQPIRPHAVSTSMNGVPAFRMSSWKYIPDSGSGGWGKGGDQSEPVQLYNLADDLGETNNLAAANPNKLAKMKEQLEKIITDGRSTPGTSQRNDLNVNRYPANKFTKIMRALKIWGIQRRSK